MFSHFKIEFNVCDKLNEDEIYENIRSMKQCLVVDFEEYGNGKLIYLLDFVDDINVMNMTNELDDI